MELMSPARSRQSPAKFGQSPVRRELLSPRVATPLRDRKRDASSFSLAQAGAPAKAHRAAPAPAGRASAGGEQEASRAEEGAKLQPEAADQRGPLQAAYLRRRLVELRRKIATSGAEQTQKDKVCGIWNRLDNLERYKMAVDSTTDLWTDPGAAADGAHWEAESHLADDDQGEWRSEGLIERTLAGTGRHGVEWQDIATGAWLGFAAAADVDEALDAEEEILDAEGEDARARDFADATGAAAPLQITIGYEDTKTGTLMCYSLCDDSDVDLAAVRVTFGEHAELADGREGRAHEQDDEGGDHESVSSSEPQTSSESASSARSDAVSSASEEVGEPHAVDEKRHEAAWHIGFVWKDDETDTMMGYVACDEQTEEEATNLGVISAEGSSDDISGAIETSTPLHITFDYQDAKTGVVMGYSLCGDGDEELEAVREVFAEGGEFVEDEEANNRGTGHGEIGRDCDPDTDWPKGLMWKDQGSGTMLAYETCGDETEDEANYLGVNCHEESSNDGTEDHQCKHGGVALTGSSSGECSDSQVIIN